MINILTKLLSYKTYEIASSGLKIRKLSDELLDADPTDVLELDELWSFVKTRRHKVWTWIALCRRTRQVVAYVCGQRNDNDVDL